MRCVYSVKPDLCDVCFGQFSMQKNNLIINALLALKTDKHNSKGEIEISLLGSSVSVGHTMT